MKNSRYWARVSRNAIAPLPTESAITVKVLLAIRTYAFDRGVGRVSYREIAEIVGIARKNVPRVIRRLEAGGFLSRVRGGPRGHTRNVYLLPDVAEDDDQTAVAEKSVLTAEGRSVLTAEDRSVLTAEDRSVLTAEDRSVLTAEDTLERLEIPENPPPRGGRSRARSAPARAPGGARPRPAGGGVDSQMPHQGKQGALLLPINGAGKHNGAVPPAYDITRYEPADELKRWAWKEYQVDATADALLGSFRDYYSAAGRRPPPDPDKAFRIWIRREFKFAAGDRHGPTRGARQPSIAELARAQMGRWGG